MRTDLKNNKRFNHHLSTLMEGYVPFHYYGDYYGYYELSRLKEEGILKEHPTGGHTVESTPKNLNFSFPLNLKDKPFDLWNEEDRIWLNT